jgi:hypothetical protein
MAVETALQRAGSALCQEMVLQRNSELALIEPRYSGVLLYIIV